MINEHPVRRYRQQNGLTCEKLGKIVGCSKAQISKIERRLFNPSLALVQRFVDRTSLKAEDFLRQPTAEAAE
jgi:transcriptional regulator with XRE-family HTH domain